MAIHIGFHLKYFTLYMKNKIIILFIVIYAIISILSITTLIKKDIYKNFIPNFTKSQYRKVKKINNINIFDNISIIILFAGGTYYICEIIEKIERKK